MKKCRTCGVIKPFTEYHIDTAKSDGFNPSCKICIAKKDKKRYNTGEIKKSKRVYSWRKVEK